VLLLVALGVAAVLIGVSSYLKAHEELDELFDYQLLQLAFSHRDQKNFDQQPAAASDYEKDEGFTVQVWDTSGTLMYVSHRNGPLPKAIISGLQTITAGNEQWRVFLLRHQGQTIQVSQSFKARQEMSFSFAVRTMVPIFFIFAALALITWLVVRYALTPLNRIASDVARRSPISLEPLPENNLPVEILPVVQRLNYLFEQLGHALDIQKRFVADAAHELRTPLTAVKLQVRILERSSGEEERSEALANLKSGVDRSARLVGQLLALARVEPEAPHFSIGEVSFNVLVHEIVTEQARIATEKGITLRAKADECACITGEADALRALISNLVDNAIRYTLPGGTVDVSVVHIDDAVRIEVADSGPGIPPESRAQVFDRFNRGERTDGGGCGLGMAIVKSAVARHGGNIKLDAASGGKGLKVTIELPRNHLK
jgi:two-component system OmpR family sensor kinase